MVYYTLRQKIKRQFLITKNKETAEDFMKLLSIIIPSFNEEKNIPNTTKVLSELLEKENINYELIFVTDG